MPMQKCNHAIRAISVFLAICLVFSCFHVLATPADATAAAVTSGLVIIGGVVGVGIILQAMGVRPSGGSGSASWQSLCSNAYAYLQTLSLATVRGISLATSGGRAYVQRDVISALRDWLYSSKTIRGSGSTVSFALDGESVLLTSLTNSTIYREVWREKDLILGISMRFGFVSIPRILLRYYITDSRFLAPQVITIITIL